MAEYRLAKVAGELNNSISVLVQHLQNHGYSIDPKPTSKITEEMYKILVGEFSADKAAKEEATLLKINRDAKLAPEFPAPKPLPKKEEPVEKAPAAKPAEPVREEKKEEKIEVVQEVKPVAPPAEETTLKKTAEKVGPKVIGKIDLERKKEPAPKKEKVVEVVPAEIPVEEKKPAAKTPAKQVKTPPAPPEEAEKLKTNFTVLSGPKVLGNILLPKDQPKGLKNLADEAREDLREKRKRKRKKVGGEKVKVADKIREEDKVAAEKTPFAGKQTISKGQVNQKVKSTMAMMGGAGRTKGNKQKLKRLKSEERIQGRIEAREQKEKDSKILKVTEFLTANELATMMDIGVNKVIQACFKLGLMVSINQRLDAETIQIVADDNGFEVEFVDAETQVEFFEEEDDEPADLVSRPPIVTVMGHVDHGKTSLLDYVRSANVIAGEAGGITQHIGAYEVTLEDGRKITFLDTPGHEAFTAMRARGAKITDLAIIVIAADDSVMPQTKEAIAHAQAANVPMIFAFNKIDKEGAKPDKIREELAAMNILVEDWGGKFQAQEISAKKGLNIDKLLDKVLLEAEMMELKANPDRRAKGGVVEATLEKGRGVVCSMLVQNGTLRVGDHLVAGPFYAKVRAMMDERGNKVDAAAPSTPIKILGFSDAPAAGDTWIVMANETEAKSLANKRMQLVREQGIRTKRHITLDEIGRRLAVGNFKELKLIVKGDVDGSVEALADSLMKLGNEEIIVTVIHQGVGQITESDVLLASASDAIIIGFQIRPSAKAKQLAEAEEIDIRTYSVIYKAIEEIKMAMEGMLSPEIIEKITGNVEIREVFKISKVGTVAGVYVTDGQIERKSKIRVIRDGVVVFTGELSSLKRFKDDMKEVTKGYEAGLQIEKFNDIQVGDYLEVYKEEEVKRKLA